MDGLPEGRFRGLGSLLIGLTVSRPVPDGCFAASVLSLYVNICKTGFRGSAPSFSFRDLPRSAVNCVLKLLLSLCLLVLLQLLH